MLDQPAQQVKYSDQFSSNLKHIYKSFHKDLHKTLVLKFLTIPLFLSVLNDIVRVF